MAGKEGEEKWRQDGIGALSGAGEEERLPHPGGLLTASGSAGREKDSGGVVGIRAEHGKWLPPGCSGPSGGPAALGSHRDGGLARGVGEATWRVYKWDPDLPGCGARVPGGRG